MTTSGIARMSKLCGHSMGTFSNTHLLGELHGHASAMKIFLHSEIASEAVFAHTYILFFQSYLYMLNIHMKVISHMLITGLSGPINKLVHMATRSS